MSVIELLQASLKRVLQAEDRDIVFSSRVRLARNVKGMPFPGRADATQLRRVIQLADEAVHSSPDQGLRLMPLSEFSLLEQEALVENYVLSRQFLTCGHENAVLLADDASLSAMVNEEDHFRLQALGGGLDLDQPFACVKAMESLFSERVSFARKRDLGYLTACPSNVGTGLRASVMFRLPALFFLGRLKRILEAHVGDDMTVRGVYGEGTEPSAHFMQVSNQVTAGSEEEILAKVHQIADRLEHEETKARAELLDRYGIETRDVVFRAVGTLTHARILGSGEATERLAQVRLGLDLGLLEGLDPAGVDRLLMLVRPATLQLHLAQELGPKERDAARADLIQQECMNLRAI